MWPSSSVPTNGSKCNLKRKVPELQGTPVLFRAKNPNAPIPGYLFSMNMEQEGYSQSEDGTPSLSQAVWLKKLSQ